MEQRDVVLVVRIKLNKIVMLRHVGRRYGLAFVILPIRFLLSPAKIRGAGEEREDLNVQPLFKVGNVIECFNLKQEGRGMSRNEEKGGIWPLGAYLPFIIRQV